jgi:hypothetical protein
MFCIGANYGKVQGAGFAAPVGTNSQKQTLQSGGKDDQGIYGPHRHAIQAHSKGGRWDSSFVIADGGQ